MDAWETWENFREERPGKKTLCLNLICLEVPVDGNSHSMQLVLLEFVAQVKPPVISMGISTWID